MKRTSSLSYIATLMLTFFSGAVIMSYEIITARMIAPLLGSSIYTWTAAIGMVLAGITLGVWLGGWVGRKHARTLLPLSYGVGGITIAAAWFIQPLLRGFIAQSPLSLPVLALAVAGVFAFIQTLTLSFAGPLFIAIITDRIENVGRQYSALSVAGSLGSIIGIFTGGFVMVPLLGIHVSLIILAFTCAGMGALSLFLFRDKTHPAIQIPASIVVIVVISVFLFVNISRPTSALMSSESPYYFTHVYDAPLQKATDTRWLFLDFDSHSVDTKGVRLGLYTDMAYVFNDLLVENNPNVLVLGAGAYTIPKILAEEMPQASIDVIEIDPSLETIGRDYFDLGNYPTIQTQTGDPRYLLPNTEKTYDLIFNDVYNSFISVPSHLVTTEFLDQIKKNLNDTGMYAMGFIGTNQGQGRAVAEHIVTTAQHVFADVRVIFFGRTDAAISSFVLLASQTSIPQSDEDLKKIISTTVPELSHVSFVTIDTPTRLLTDHWQPLENLMRPLMKRYFPRYKEIYYRVTNPRV